MHSKSARLQVQYLSLVIVFIFDHMHSAKCVINQIGLKYMSSRCMVQLKGLNEIDVADKTILE